MALTRPDASQVAYGSRTLQQTLDDYINVKRYGAVGDGTTDDTAAIQSAVAAAVLAGKKRLRFPAGNYLHSDVLATFTSSDWEVSGDGKTNTRLTQTADTDSFRVDVSEANLYRVVFRDMELMNTHATGLNASGIRVVASTSSATGLKHPTFDSLRFRGQGLAGIYYEATGKVDDVYDSIDAHSFGLFLDLEFPQYTRYPLGGVYFEAGTGPHQLFLGGQYRADPTAGYGIRAGTGGANVSVGDLIINGIHFVIGSAGVSLQGPSNDVYRASVCITGCQFDVMTDYTMVLSRLEKFHVFANNYKTGSPASLTNMDFSESIWEGKDYVAIRGLIVDSASSTASRIGIAPGTGTNPPKVYANSTQTNMDLVLEAKGTGNVRFGTHAAIGAETVTGYITVKDSGGTVRKLAVVS